MKLKLEHRAYRLPFRVPVNTAHGPWVEREGIHLRITAEDGRSGLGEVAPVTWFGTESVAQALELLGGLGEMPSLAELEALPAEFPCLKHGLGAALRRAGLLGEATPVLQKYLPVAALLPAGRAALERARVKADSGFRVFKWKVGVGDAADELAILDDLLGVLPQGSLLRLDANGAWDRRRAERWLERCAERPIEFVEQPVSAEGKGSEDLLLGLAGDFPVRIGLDESLVAERDFERWLELSWPGIYVVKPALLAKPWARVAMLRRRGADIVFSSSLETRIGAAEGLALAFAQEGKGRALGFGVWPLFRDPAMEGPEAAPFIRAEDLERINLEDTWNANS